MKVLINGAGVAGLSCALALRKAGVLDITIVERSSEVSAQGGTGIAIPPNGARALASIGVPIDRLIAGGSLLRRYRLLDRSGKELTCADLTRLWLSPEEPYFAVHRRRLYEVLLATLAGQSIEFKTTATLQADDLASDAPVLATITGPGGARQEHFDLVVGADGIRSSVRQVMWPKVAPRPLGWWTWRCTLDWDGSESEAQVVYSGRGGVILYIPLAPGQVYVYAACRESGDARRPDGGHGADVVARFGDFGAPGSLLEALAGLPDASFHAGPLEELPHEQVPTAGKGRTILVGDALHACSPSMAQGVSLAAEDAGVLADVVSKTGAASAVEQFWQRRLPRIRHVQEHTRKRDHLVNKRADSALFQRVSNVVIRMRGGDRMQREVFAYLLENRA